jgi:hypothetical protein
MLALTGPSNSDTKDDVRRKSKMRKANSDQVRQKKRALRALAATAGVSDEEMFKGLPGYGVIVEEAAAVSGVPSNFQYGMWRLVSGLTHPSASRAITMSVIEEMPGSSDRIIKAELTASPSLTNTAIDACLLLHWKGLDLLAERGGKPELAFRIPPEFPLPPGYEYLRTTAQL